MVWAPVFTIATTDGPVVVMASGTVSHWTAIDQGSIWSFIRTFAPTKMVCHYEQSWHYLLKHFTVPVVVVFTKYDQFLRNVTMDVSDYPDKYSDRSVSEVANEQFQEHYLHPLGDVAVYVQLESEWQVIARVICWYSLEEMHINGSHCGDLIEKTAAALNEDAVMLMLVAVQRNNVELSVKLAWRR